LRRGNHLPGESDHTAAKAARTFVAHPDRRPDRTALNAQAISGQPQPATAPDITSEWMKRPQCAEAENPGKRYLQTATNAGPICCDPIIRQGTDAASASGAAAGPFWPECAAGAAERAGTTF
jgi:hypothetical protein